LKAEALPEIKREQTTPQPAQDPKNRILGRETPSPTPPAPIETKTALPVPKAEPKPVAPAPKKEVKTEPKPENISKIPKSDLPMGKEPSPSKTNSQPNHTVVVKAGDSIYSIAAEAYRVSNTSVVDRILEVNPKISNPDLLPTKQQIKLPIITEESLVLKSPDGFFRVLLGAFMKPEFADYLKGQPVLQEKEIEILPWTSPSGKTWYRVTVGKFESREEGLKVIRILKENGLSPYFEGFKKKN
jgi:phage tail protein X